MSYTAVSPMRRKIRAIADELQISSNRKSVAAEIKSLTNKVLSGWNAVSAPSGSLGLESYGEVVPKRNDAFVSMDADPRDLMNGLKKLGMSRRHIEPVTESVFNLFDKDCSNGSEILRGGQESQGKYLSLAQVVGRTSAAQISSLGEGAALEAFGDDINRLNTDDRLTMDLIIMRPWDNIMDKALARVNESSPVVTIRVPAPQAWDWAATQNPNSTTESRNNNNYRLRDLYRNPSPVNSAPKKIVALAANDHNAVLWNNTTNYYVTSKDVKLIDLAMDSTRFGYGQADRTDLISDGGIIDNVIISLKTAGGSSVTEYFRLETRVFDMAMFVISPNNKKSGQRQVIMECTLPISATTKQWDGTTASTIAAALTDAKIKANIRISATLDIQTGVLQASGSVNLELVALASGVAISGATNTLFGGLQANIAAYSASLFYDEENQRKANLAVWVQYYEQQFVVPRSRVYFTEYSMTQDVDENAVAATSSIVALGNGRRGLDIVVNALNDVTDGLAYTSANPEIASENSIDEQSFAASLVKPTVITSSLDFDAEDINVMNESTRLTEIHGRFRARFLSMVTMLFAKSLMLNQYKGGERPVIKAWVHSTIADLVIGIIDYHPDLKDEASLATGADYSMTLPNGYRLDVIKSNFDCLQQRIYAVPVIESDMASILSAASIRDCGTVTTNYTPTNGGAVTRRVATTCREIVMMSNKVGMCLEVKGLEQQLGDIGYTKFELSPNHSESIAM